MPNSDSADQSGGPKEGARACLTCLTTALALAIAASFGIRYLREQSRVALERQQAAWRQKWFSDVKNGNCNVVVSDMRLLPMLAADSDCVANLVDVTFAMVNIEPADAKHISRLSNVQSIGFYDTRGAEHVLEHARDLPIQKLFFECAIVPGDCVRGLSEFPGLKQVRFEQVMDPDEIAILRTLPPTISVQIPDPSEDGPPT